MQAHDDVVWTCCTLDTSRRSVSTTHSPGAGVASRAVTLRWSMHLAGACPGTRSRSSTTGVNGVGLFTAQPAALVERIVAASLMASSVRNPFHGPCPAFGRLMKADSRHALLNAMYSCSPWLCGTSGSEPPCRIISGGSAARDVAQRIRGLHLLRAGLNGAPDEPRFRRRRVVMATGLAAFPDGPRVHRQEVRRRIESDGRLYPAGHAGRPDAPSSSGASPVTAAIAVVQPPELSPMIPIRSGSRLYLPAFARSHRIAALMSCNWPGNCTCELERIETPATA